MELKKVKKSRKVIFAILSVFCIVLSFLSPISSYAFSSASIGTLYDITDDDILYKEEVVGSDVPPFVEEGSNQETYIKNCIQSNFTVTNYQYFVDEVDYPNYIVMYQQNYIDFVPLPENAFVTYNTNTNYIYIYAEKNKFVSGNSYRCMTAQFNNDGSYHAYYDINMQSYRNNTYSKDSIDYGLLTSAPNTAPYNTCFMTSCPVYSNDDTSNSFDSIDFSNNLNYLDNSEDYTDLLDHLTLYENSKMYISASSFNEGTLYIYPIMDDYQKEHSDAFYLRLVGTCSYNVRSNSSADTIVTWGGQKTRDLYNIGQQNKTISSSLSSSSGSYIDIPFNSISGGVTSYSMDFLNDSFPTIYDYRIKPLASSLSTTYDNYITTFSKFISGVKVNGFSIDPTAIYDGDIDVICSDCLYHFDLYVGNGDNISTSPVLSWDSDFVNGTGSSNFDNLSSLEDVQNATGSGSNSLPAEYYFSNDVPSYNNSVSGGGSSSSSSSPSTSTSQGGDSNNNITTGDNNQVVNTGSTNVTVNNDNGTAKYVPTIINKLLPNSEGDGGLSNDVQDLVNSNGWVTFMKTTYSFIPPAFWDKIVLYFGACLTITACAFLLRIILDLL